MYSFDLTLLLIHHIRDRVDVHRGSFEVAVNINFQKKAKGKYFIVITSTEIF